MDKLPVYECKILNADDTGIFALSFVDFPANESNFVALSKQVPVKLNLNKHKRILTGAVLIPDQMIYRKDEERGEYYIKFTAQDIERIAVKMMKTGLALRTTTHQHAKPLKGNYLLELWIVKDPKRDKSVALGLGEMPEGTLMASYKVEDAHYWRTQVLTGKVKGFSIEGFFNFKTVKMSKPVTKKPAQKKIGGLKGGLAAMFTSLASIMLEGETKAETEDLTDVAAEDNTDSGTPYLVFELAEGGEVDVDSEGFATLDGEQMAAGEHQLADGNVLVIDDNGYMVETTDEETPAEPDAAEAALRAEAKERGKALLAKLAKDTKPPVKVKSAKDAKIEKLEAELAKLKTTPSAKPKTAKSEVKAGKAAAEMSKVEKMAQVIKNRQERAK